MKSTAACPVGDSASRPMVEAASASLPAGLTVPTTSGWFQQHNPSIPVDLEIVLGRLLI